MWNNPTKFTAMRLCLSSEKHANVYNLIHRYGTTTGAELYYKSLSQLVRRVLDVHGYIQQLHRWMLHHKHLNKAVN